MRSSQSRPKALALSALPQAGKLVPGAVAGPMAVAYNQHSLENGEE